MESFGHVGFADIRLSAPRRLRKVLAVNVLGDTLRDTLDVKR